MSLHYLLDGHNVLHQMSLSNQTKFDDERKHLIQFIELKRPQGSLNNKVTIVFDGYPPSGVRFESTVVDIVFSCDDSADERIKKIVNQANLKKSIITVTNDRAIQYAVRAAGAKVIKAEEFLNMGAASKSITPSGSQSKKVSEQEASDITSEMKDVWLKKKE